MKYLKNYLINFIDINKKESRKSFWVTMLWVALFVLIFIVVVSLLAGIVLAILKQNNTAMIYKVSTFIASFIAIFNAIPFLSLLNRRIKDAGYSPVLSLLIFVPFGIVVLFVITLLPTKK
ncbi:MAG: DUF805 domain-containing protein [Lactobacillaceae bacterium]|jgi:uncharacterized membrane protein YhaH (DUF805 family)|nr:DUF805 domain-containing protein [Lactobacillaceae bacterium]